MRLKLTKLKESVKVCTGESKMGEWSSGKDEECMKRLDQSLDKSNEWPNLFGKSLLKQYVLIAGSHIAMWAILKKLDTIFNFNLNDKFSL